MVDLFPFCSHLKAWISSQTVTQTALQGFQLSLSEIKMERKMSCICRRFLLSSCFLRCLCWMCAYLTQKLPKPMQPLPDNARWKKNPSNKNTSTGRGFILAIRQGIQAPFLLLVSFRFFFPTSTTHQ